MWYCSLNLLTLLHLGELAFWPHPPPLIAHPVISYPRTSSQFPFTTKEFWLPQSRLPQRHPILAVETDYLPTTALAMETSFFRWFGAFFVHPMVNYDIIVVSV